MSKKGGLPENLKSFTPGDPRAVECGKKSKRSRSIKSILSDFMEREPEEIFKISEEEACIAKQLKKIGCKTTKDLIYWRLCQRAAFGDIQAMKMLAEHLGEDPGTILKIGGAEGLPPIKMDNLNDMSIQELKGLSDVFAKVLDES